MGTNLICCRRTENISNIIKHKDELSHKEEYDYLNFEEKNNNTLNNEIELVIETDLPLEFPHNLSQNNINSQLLQKNNYENNQQEILKSENPQFEDQIIFSTYNLQNTEISKLNKFFELCNKNGKPRPYDDFNIKGWTKFYPTNDQYFVISVDKNDIIEHNKLKIYNQNDINKMKIYQGDLNLIGERHGIGKFITPYYVLIGMWKNDTFSGWGRESRCNGDTFEGRFENGIINGKGIFMNSKNSKYIGDFKNMKRWGKGKLATDKIIYEGDFYNNMIHGKGRIKFLENSVEYIGNFNSNKIDGRGVIKFKSGDKYEVEIKNGEIIKIENDVFENSNGGNFDYLLTKRDIKKDLKKSNLELNGLQPNGQINNDINGLDIGNINTEQMEDQDHTPEFLLSTYRNFGFSENNETTSFK